MWHGDTHCQLQGWDAKRKTRGRPAGSERVKTQRAEPVRSRWIARAFIRSPGLIADSSCRGMFLLRENIPCSFVFVRLCWSAFVFIGQRWSALVACLDR